jgi:hypothetical protein
VVGQFSRECHPIFLVVNVGHRSYHGRVKLSGSSQWQLWNPANGHFATAQTYATGKDLEFTLPSYEAILIVGSE